MRVCSDKIVVNVMEIPVEITEFNVSKTTVVEGEEFQVRVGVKGKPYGEFTLYIYANGEEVYKKDTMLNENGTQTVVTYLKFEQAGSYELQACVESRW